MQLAGERDSYLCDEATITLTPLLCRGQVVLVGGSEDGWVSASADLFNKKIIASQSYQRTRQVSVWNVSAHEALGVSNVGLELLVVAAPIGNGIMSSVIVYDNV
jgi:hypothetical protein